MYRRKKLTLESLIEPVLRALKVFGWATVVVMALVQGALFYQWGRTAEKEYLFNYSECQDIYEALSEDQVWKFNDKKREFAERYLKNSCPDQYEEYKRNNRKI